MYFFYLKLRKKLLKTFFIFSILLFPALSYSQDLQEKSYLRDKATIIKTIRSNIGYPDEFTTKVLIVPNLFRSPTISGLIAKNIQENLVAENIPNVKYNYIPGIKKRNFRDFDDIIESYVTEGDKKLILTVDVLTEEELEEENKKYDILISIFEDNTNSEVIYAKRFSDTLDNITKSSFDQITGVNLEEIVSVINDTHEKLEDFSVAYINPDDEERAEYILKIDDQVIPTNLYSDGFAYFPNGEYQVDVYQVITITSTVTNLSKTRERLLGSFTTNATTTKYFASFKFFKTIEYPDHPYFWYPLNTDFTLGIINELFSIPGFGPMAMSRARYSLSPNYDLPIYVGMSYSAGLDYFRRNDDTGLVQHPKINFGYTTYFFDTIILDAGANVGLRIISDTFETQALSFYSYFPTIGIDTSIEYYITPHIYIIGQAGIDVLDYSFGSFVSLQSNISTGSTAEYDNFYSHALIAKEFKPGMVITPSIGAGWRF